MDGAIAAIVLLGIVVRGWWWMRKTDLSAAKTEVLAALDERPRHAAPQAVAAPLSRRALTITTCVMFSLGLVTVALAAMFSWNEYSWMDAEVARARFVKATANAGGVVAEYRVQP